MTCYYSFLLDFKQSFEEELIKKLVENRRFASSALLNQIPPAVNHLS